jgi:peptidoglycan/xylan/chitin deacetylase (PgdA/CDA1 family)
MKWWLKFALAVLIYYSGGLSLFRRWRAHRHGPQLRILAYHSVADSPRYLNMSVPCASFARQMRHLSQHYHAVTMREIEALLERGEPPTRDLVVVTLDDGYRDNYSQALPLAVAYGIPLTMFVATYYVDSDTPTLIYALMLAFDATVTARVDLTDLGLRAFDFHTHREREQAISDIDGKAKSLPFANRQGFVNEVVRRLDLDPTDPLFRDRMVTWDQVREMRRAGACIGAHTVTHPVLSRISLDDAVREIRDSRDRVSQELAEPVTSFAYPYGGRHDINEDVLRIVSRLGFRSAVTLYPDTPEPNKRWTLGRMLVSDEMSSTPWGSFSDAVFACEVSGLFETLARRPARSSEGS